MGSRKVPRGLRGRHVMKEHQRKLRTSRGTPRHMRICTAKASGISRETVKSRCAREWGGWGRISEDGPGQQTRTGARAPGTVEREAACTEVLTSASPRTQSREYRWQQTARRTVANQHAGKAPSEIRALKAVPGQTRRTKF